MAAADGHPFWHIVDNVRRLETSQRLSMSRNSGFVESADALLVSCSSAMVIFSFSSVLDSVTSRRGPRDNRCAAIGCEIPLTRYSTRIAPGNAAPIGL